MASVAAAVDSADLTEEERLAELERYEILTTWLPTSAANLYRIRIDALCNAPISLVHEVITDVRGYERFMPKVVRSRVLKTRGNQRIVLIETKLPWPLENAWNILKVTEYTKSDVLIMTWSRLKGSLEENRGFWVLRPHEEGRKTMFTYELEAMLPSILPDAFVTKHMKKVGLDYAYAVRAEVKRLKHERGFTTTGGELGSDIPPVKKP